MLQMLFKISFSHYFYCEYYNWESVCFGLGIDLVARRDKVFLELLIVPYAGLVLFQMD